MENGYSLADISAATGGTMGGGNSFFWIFALLALMNGGGFGWNRGGDFGQYATAASQQEILFGQQFQNLDNKLDRLGNGIADATFALNNSVHTSQDVVSGAVIAEGRALQTQLADHNCGVQKNIDSVRFDMSNYAWDIKTNDNANTQKILDVLAQNKIESLQGRINQLELQSAMCGVVRYPNQMTYDAGRSPFCNCGGCGCGNI